MGKAEGPRLALMAVHAHPDDEVFTGGLLAKAAAEGVHTVVVCATRGEAGEIHDPDLDPEEARERLGELREAELRRACAILSVAEVYILGYRDSGMAGTPENDDPRNFCNADPEEAAGRVVRLIRQVRPQVIVTYDERGGYGHPDHIAAHRATVAALAAAGDPDRFTDQSLPPWQPQKLYYIAFPRSTFLRLRDLARDRGLSSPFDDADFDPVDFTVPDEVVTTRVDVRDYLAQRRTAMLAHRTQIPPDHPLLTMPEDLTRELWGTEAFTRAQSLVPAPEKEDDLFAGLRSN
jgi:mycothiol conjugate amidase Mca